MSGYDEVKEKELRLSTVVCKKCYRLVDRLDKALDEIACLKSRFKRIEETQKSHKYPSRAKRCAKSPHTKKNRDRS